MRAPATQSLFRVRSSSMSDRFVGQRIHAQIWLIGAACPATLAGRAPGDLVFTTLRGEVMRNHNFRSRVFKPAAELIGVPGLFGDDLDPVSDRLDEAAARARADYLRTQTPLRGFAARSAATSTSG